MQFKKSLLARTSALFFVVLMSGCASSHPPLPTPEQVDLERFMGAWFVHGYTPILVDKKAHNAVEHYFLNQKGNVETTYQFRDGAFNGELKTFTPKGFPEEDDPSDARWKMQFIWPFKADYVILHVSDDYQSTIIAHPNRKYAWIMDRSHEIEESTYKALLKKLEAVDYDPAVIQRLPQDWSDESKRLEQIDEVGSGAPLAAR